MAAAIFSVKFAIPSLSAHFLHRPRLAEVWRRPGCRLVTAVAGPGWGKTDFLAQQAHSCAPRVLWYTLDDLDRDPTVLMAHLGAASGLPPSSAPPLEQLASVISHLDTCHLLVLDDVHAIKQAPAARELVARLLRYLPAGCTLALGSREPVDLSAARLDSRGQSVHLGTDDLALTTEETRQSLAGRLDPGVAARLVERVQDLTEGWPMGHEICCQALAGSASPLHPDSLAPLEEGHDRWFDVFAGEIVAGLPDELRAFLLQTSVLPHLEAGLCDELLGIGDSAPRLAELAGRGLFLASVGRRSWRTHNLMRRCLQNLFRQEASPRERRRLGRRAADLLAARGEPEAAALDLVRDQDHEGACRLLGRQAHQLAETTRPQTLGLAMAGLPGELVEKDPRLLLIRACLADLQGRWDEAEDDMRRALRRRPAARIAGALRARLIRSYQRRGEFARSLAAGKRALTGAPRLEGGDRGLVLASMGVAAASLGQLDRGRSYLTQALELARRRGHGQMEGRCLFLMAANIDFVRGDLEAALQGAGRAREIFTRSRRPDLACHATGVLGFVLAGHGRPGEAREASLWALQRAESIGYRLIAGYAHLTLGHCDLLVCEPTAAREHFDQALHTANRLGELALETWARLGLAESAWRRGDGTRACREAEQALSLATRQGELFSQGRALAQLGRVQEHGSSGSGLATWQRAEKIFRRLGAVLELARLQRWRSQAGHDVSARLPGAPDTSRLQALLDRVEPPAAPLGPAGTETRADRSEPKAPVLDIRLLGPLAVTGGGGPLSPAEWRSRRARRLFQLLVLGHGRTLAREQVMEALWPEAPPAKATVNLRQTVFQLRKILEPGQGTGPVHVLTEGEAIRLDLGPGGRCDLDLFQDALRRAQSHRRAAGSTADHAAEMEALEQATSLWRGPLLADSPYDPEVEETATVVRHRFLSALERLMGLHAARQEWAQVVERARQALAEDPLRENFVGHLLRGLLALGQPHLAREAYTRFEANLLRELDLLPSESLKDLAEQAEGGH